MEIYRNTISKLFAPSKFRALSTPSESKALLALAERHKMLSIAINRSLSRSSSMDRLTAPRHMLGILRKCQIQLVHRQRSMSSLEVL